MALVATCADETQPAAGADFSSCTAVVWQEPVSPWPELTPDQGMQLAGAAIGLWCLAWVLNFILNIVKRRRF